MKKGATLQRSKRTMRILVSSLVLLAVFVAGLIVGRATSPRGRLGIDEMTIRTYPNFFCRVVEVVDPRTLRAIYKGSESTIELLGLAPPTVGQPGYEEAKNALEELTVKKDSILSLEFDSSAFGGGEQLQAYLGPKLHGTVGRWRGPWNLNLEMVWLGWARYDSQLCKSTRYDDRFRWAEEEAKRHEGGVWGIGGFEGESEAANSDSVRLQRAGKAALERLDKQEVKTDS